MNLPNIIFIMGDTRSGSTALAIALDGASQLRSVGELRFWPIYEGGIKPGDEAPEHVAFWQRVAQAYNRQGDPPDFQWLRQVHERFEYFSHFPLVLLRRYPQEEADAYCRHHRRLFLALAEVTGSGHLIDSSKPMGRALMLHRCFPGLVKVIHLVRDPRGQFWSFQKRSIEQRTKPALRTVRDIWVRGIMSQFTRWALPADAYMRLRYEDFVLQPVRAMERLGRFLSVDLSAVGEQIMSEQPFTVPSLLDGNRIRRQSELVIQPDLAWRTGLSRVHSFVLWLATAPLNVINGHEP